MVMNDKLPISSLQRCVLDTSKPSKFQYALAVRPAQLRFAKAFTRLYVGAVGEFSGTDLLAAWELDGA